MSSFTFACLLFLSKYKRGRRPITPRLWYERHHIDTDTVTPSRRCLSIPPGTKAFLYYFTSQQRPRIAGELRLRVVPSDDPASFESESDLLRFNCQIWSRSLYMLSKYYIPLYEKLKEHDLFHTTWTQFYRLLLKWCPDLNFSIHRLQ